MPAFPLDLWEEETDPVLMGEIPRPRKRALSPTTLLHPSGYFWDAFTSAAAKLKKTIEHLKKGKPASNSTPCRHTPFHTGRCSESSLKAGNSGFPILIQIIRQSWPISIQGSSEICFWLCTQASSLGSTSLTGPTN